MNFPCSHSDDPGYREAREWHKLPRLELPNKTRERRTNTNEIYMYMFDHVHVHVQ